MKQTSYLLHPFYLHQFFLEAVARTWGPQIDRLHVFGRDGVPPGVYLGGAKAVSFNFSEK